ncbi:hydroxymethylbilane synthase [bacterium]|nr:hydroxymethylbilane synthase [bacterium]
MKIRIGARRSDLARVQAMHVRDCLLTAHPHLGVEFLFKKSLGDINLHDPLWKMPEKGVFTQDLTKDLVNGECDLVVHSWKDLPTELAEQTEVVATTQRADPRDLILIKKEWLDQPSAELKVFSSSPRRAFNLDPFLKEFLPSKPKHVEFLDIRGNVPTRVQKLIESKDASALVVAKAALDRLVTRSEIEFEKTKKQLLESFKSLNFIVVPLRENPNAAAQGALAIEIRKNDQRMRDLLMEIHCEKTFSDVQEERKILKYHGGGCHQKIGVSVRSTPSGVWIRCCGKTEAGVLLNDEFFESFRPLPKVSVDKVWSAEGISFFKREEISVQWPKQLDALWVAKADALPVTYTEPRHRLLWTAGLDSWKKLVDRGFFVNGCSESFGEDQDDPLSFIGRPIVWTKLSHVDGAISKDKEFLATYKLENLTLRYEDFQGFELFYWKSFSQFKRSLECFPELKTKLHACGLGHTARLIEEETEVAPLAFPTKELFLKALV